MASSIEIPSCFCHHNNADYYTQRIWNTKYLFVYFNLEYHRLEKNLLDGNILFHKEENRFNVDLKSLIVNVFINNDIDMIDQIIQNETRYKFNMLIDMFVLAVRFSNINTVNYFVTKDICTISIFYIIK
jgi:hypothetical protein